MNAAGEIRLDAQQPMAELEAQALPLWQHGASSPPSVPSAGIDVLGIL